jgi:hypothetical protein
MSTPKKTRYTLIKGKYWIHSPDNNLKRQYSPPSAHSFR